MSTCALVNKCVATAQHTYTSMRLPTTHVGMLALLRVGLHTARTFKHWSLLSYVGDWFYESNLRFWSTLVDIEICSYLSHFLVTMTLLLI